FALIYFGAAVGAGMIDYYMFHGSVVSSLLNNFGVLAEELRIPAIVASLQSVPAMILAGTLFHALPARMRKPYLVLFGVIAILTIFLIGWNSGAHWMSDRGIAAVLPADDGVSSSAPAVAAKPAAPSAAPAAGAGGWIGWVTALAGLKSMTMAAFFVSSTVLGGAA